MSKRKRRIWGLFYLGEEIDRFDGDGDGTPMSKKEAEKAFMLDTSIYVNEIKEEYMVKCLLCDTRLGSTLMWTCFEPLNKVPHYFCEHCMQRMYDYGKAHKR